jgi:hypothetical protein
VFSGKNVSDLIQEIYDRQKEQDATLKEKLVLLSSYIETPGDAIVMMPLIKDLMDTGVRNNEVLLKIVQLFKQSAEQKASGESGSLTQKDIEDLFNELPPSAFGNQQKLIK